MKCPKCSYVSHDYLDTCRKCGVDLVSFKQNMGLLILQPGVLDLSFVLGETGADDLFESVEEEITRHDGNDGDFDINLDDHPEHPEARPVSGRMPRAGGRETTENVTGLDHLTLELDVSALSAQLAASLSGALSDTPPQPPTPAVPPPEVPNGSELPDHVPLDLEPNSGSIALPSGAFAELAATPVERSETTDSVDAGQAEGIDAVVSMAEDSGVLASLASQGIVLAEDIPVAPEEQVPEIVELDMPTIELLDVDAAADRSEVEMRTESPEVEAGDLVDTTLDSFAIPTFDDATLMLTDENEPPPQPSYELMAVTGDTTPEDALTSADMFTLADMEGVALPGELTIDLSPPDTGSEQSLTTPGVLPLEDPDDTTLSGDLTLDLDMSEIMADWSSTTLVDVQLDDLSGHVQSEMSPPQNQAGAEEELRLDLDEAESDDDTPA